jgi:hypothetical protein
MSIALPSGSGQVVPPADRESSTIVQRFSDSVRNTFDSLRRILEQPSVATLERIAGGLVVAACAFLLISASVASNAAPRAEASPAVQQSTQQPAAGQVKHVARHSTPHATKSKSAAAHRSTPPPQGVDYSFAHPDPHQLRAAGKSFVVRYLTGGAPKALSHPEAHAVRAAGLDVVSNYEETTSDLTSGGFDHGVALAKKAEAAHRASGGPAKAPIYFSADSSPSGWSPAQWDSFRQNLQGIASVIGVDRVGLYGGTLALKTAQANHYATWFWQSLGWRDGQWLGFAHLQQHEIETPLGGGTVDMNRAQSGNYGQWGAAK